MLLDIHGVVLVANLAAAETLRLVSAEIQGKRIVEILSDLNAWVFDLLTDANRAGCETSATRQELYLEHSDEWVLVDLKCLPLQHFDHNSPETFLLVITNREKEDGMRRLMSRYMSDDLVARLAAKADEGQLGGTSQYVSTLFSDIRDFTRLSESLGPAQTVSMLNEYFSYVEDVISNRSGVVDKYIGDAVMAVFGLAGQRPEDAENAVQAACDMRLVLGMLNQSRVAGGRPLLRIGVGVASGLVIAGNIGSPRRMDYTVVGDPVNLAARLESITKLYGSMVMICGQTRARLVTLRTIRKLDRFAVSGQDQAVDVYEVLDHHEELSSMDTATKEERIEGYQEALALYLAGEWKRASRCFEGLQPLYTGDRAAQLMVSRCRKYLDEPPTNWEGYTRLSEK
jgi:adenylate cyclase